MAMQSRPEALRLFRQWAGPELIRAGFRQIHPVLKTVRPVYSGDELDGPVVLVATPEKEHEAAVRLGRIGMDRVLGYLGGGFGTASKHTQLLAHTARITPADLAETLEGDDAPLVLDVRQPGEWDAGHVEHALHVPLGQLEARIEEVPADRDLVVMCKSGYRSSIAASLLARNGRTRVQDLVGGFDAWSEAGHPVTAPVG